ncbi:MAG: SPOR domain-containing protein [Bacteroidota bacterium]
MKNLALLVVLALLVSSCNLFKKPSMSQKEIDALITEKQNLEKQLQENNAMYEQQISDIQKNSEQKIADLQKQVEKCGTGKYHVIVGSFKTPAYADEYAAKIRTLGYDGEVLTGKYSFKLVTSSSHESLKSALAAMQKARESVSAKAWVYIE